VQKLFTAFWIFRNFRTQFHDNGATLRWKWALSSAYERAVQSL